MAGYSNKRDENYEVKYLRKMLGQVDSRIQIPKSLEAQSLLPLLDGIEAPVYEARRRPRWLSLQSGIAYAAAFALIVALFYSMEMYRPEMIDGGMRIAGQSASQLDSPSEASTETGGGETQPADDLILVGDGDGNLSEQPEPEPVAMPETQPEANADAAPAAVAYGVGGVESVLLLEQDNTSYYYRLNDATDPDRQAPVTLEIVDTSSQEFVARIDIPEMDSINRCFVSENRILVVGQDEDTVVISTLDNADPANPTEVSSYTRRGEFVDARTYQDIVHVAAFSSEHDNAVTLPHAVSEDCLAITAYNTETGESYTKTFIGAKGTVQLHNLNAYIHYEGEDEDGEAEYYIAQISLDGMDIELTTVS